MYEAYWKLQRTPFCAGGDDGWFYESPAHEEALARMDYVVEHRRSCGILMGPAGTGKTTLLANLSRELRRSQRQAILFDLTGLTGEDALRELAERLHLGPAPAARPFQLWRGVRDYLHGLSRSEQQIVCLLDHFERGNADCAAVVEQLLHVIDDSTRCCTLLIAAEQSAVGGALARLIPLSGLSIELPPLNRFETSYYVHESLKRAGAESEVFEPQGVDAVYAVTHGVIRDVNRLCELALLAGMADERQSIDAETVIEAADNLPHAAGSAARDQRAAATA